MAVGIRALDCKLIYFFIISEKKLSALTTGMEGGLRGGGGDTGIKWAIYIYTTNIIDNLGY